MSSDINMFNRAGGHSTYAYDGDSRHNGDTGQNSLHEAVIRGSVHEVTSLLRGPNARDLCRQIDMYGRTPSALARELGYENLAEIIDAVL